MASTCSSPPHETKLVKLRYADTLEPATRARYHEKIRLVGNTDPYEVGKGEWSADVSLWPEINYRDIFNYLVSKQSAHTREDFEDIKSLTAYNHFLSGLVKNAGCVRKNDLCLMSARVRPSQRTNGTPHRPWLIAERSGQVLAAHCDCTAASGEACSHIGALLFSVEAGVKHLKSTAGREKADWLLPSAVDQVPYAEVRDIDFTSAKSQKRLLDQTVPKSSDADTHRVSQHPLGFHQIPPPTEEELQQCFDQLLASGLKPAVLALDSRYADRYVSEPPTQNSPQAMLEHKGDQCFTMTTEELMEQREPSCEPPEDTPEHFFHVESMNQGQADDKLRGDGDDQVMGKRRKV